MSFFPIPMIVGGRSYLINGAGKFEAANSQYLSRTYGSSPTSRKKGSLRFLMHLGSLASGSTQHPIYCVGDTNTQSNFSEIVISSDIASSPDHMLQLCHRTSGGTVYAIRGAPLYRDVGGFGDFLITWDTTLATPEAHIYQWVLDGWVELTYDSNNFGSMPQNTDLWFFSSTYQTRIGRGAQSVSTSHYFDGYLAELTTHDGTVISTSDLAEADNNGYEGLKSPSGLTFGNYGGYYKFENGSEGADSSGNSMTFTNLGVVGVNNSPTNDADNDVGLYPVLSVLDTMPSESTISLAGLRLTGTGTGGWYGSKATLTYPGTGRYVYKATVGQAASSQICIGVTRSNWPHRTAVPYNDSNFYGYFDDGQIYKAGALETTVTAFSNTDYVEVDYDRDNSTIRWYLNGSLEHTTTGVDTGADIPIIVHRFSSGTVVDMDFGQLGFTPTSGENYLCTAHFPDGIVSDPETGSFTGNANEDGPVVHLGGLPDTSQTSTINGNNITWGTDADALVIGFKLRTNSANYNSSGSNTYSIQMKHALVKGAAQARTV